MSAEELKEIEVYNEKVDTVRNRFQNKLLQKENEICSEIEVLWSMSDLSDDYIEAVNDRYETVYQRVSSVYDEILAEERIKVLDSYKKQEKKLCTQLGLPPVHQSFSDEPSVSKLKDLKEYLNNLKKEREKRNTTFLSILQEIEKLTEELKISRPKCIEVVSPDEENGVDLSENNISKLKNCRKKLSKRAKKNETLRLKEELVSMMKILQVDSKEYEKFFADVEKNTDEFVLKKFREELDRYTKLVNMKKQHIPGVFLRRRREIENLWNVCNIEEEDRKSFIDLVSIQFNKELLTSHEREIFHLSKFQEENSKVASKTGRKLKIQTNDIYHVIVVHVNEILKTQIYVCKDEEAADVSSRIMTVTNNDLKLLPKNLLKRNQLAMFPMQDHRYRIRILNVDGDNIDVVFIDNGTFCVVDINSIYCLPDDYLTAIPPLAFRVDILNIDQGKPIEPGEYLSLKIISQKRATYEGEIINRSVGVTNVADFLERWNLKSELKEHFDELCTTGIIKFQEESAPSASANATSSDAAKRQDEEQTFSVQNAMKKIEHIRKKIKTCEMCLISLKLAELIKEADMLSLYAFALQSFGLLDVDLHQHVKNMLVACSYSEKCIQFGITSNLQIIHDLNNILNGSSSSRAVKNVNSKQTDAFMKNFNETLTVQEANPILAASTIMINFLNLNLFDATANLHLGRILFNLILRRKGWPYVVFPSNRDEIFSNAVNDANKSQLTSYQQFVFNSCLKSLETYFHLIDTRLKDSMAKSKKEKTQFKEHQKAKRTCLTDVPPFAEKTF